MPVLINPFGFLSLPVWNSADKDPNVTLSSGDRAWSITGGNTGGVRSTTSVSGVKRYAEMVVDSFGADRTRWRVGIANSSFTITDAPGSDTNSWVLDGAGDKWTNNSAASISSNLSSNDIIMIAFNGSKLWFGVNGSWLNSGDPAAGTNEAFSGLSGSMFLIAGADTADGTCSGELAASLTYSPPTGFTAGWA